MPVPVGSAPGQKWEIEFTAGVWTDVTADVEFGFASPPQTHYGRTSQFTQPGPGSETLALRNPLGRYTPQRQVLTDGVTPHPFWPNVTARKRLRRSYTVGGVTYYRFFGYVKGFPPSLYSGVLPVVPITATDRMDQLSRVKMVGGPITQQNTNQAKVDAVSWWLLTDDAGSTQSAQAKPGQYSLGVVTGGAALVFGDNGPGVGDGTGIKFAPGTSSTGQLLQGQFTPPGGHGSAKDTFTVEIWVNAGTSLPAWAVAGNENILGAYSATGGLQALLYLNAGVPTFQDSSVTISGAASIVDGGWHHLAVIRTHPAGYQAEFVVDGVSAGTAATTATDRLASLVIGDGGAAVTAARFQGNAGQVVIKGPTSASYCAGQFAAVGGYSGDTTAARIARYLGYAGLTAADWALDAGQTTFGTYPQAGKDIPSACQDMATTEGGVFWIRWDGQARLANRRFRDSATPVLILDASVPALLEPDVWDPAFDETTLVNTSTVSRSAESGTLSTQTYTDPVSSAPPPTGFGESDADVTTYTQSDQDALNLAQAQVAGNAFPAFRLNQLAVNFHAATTSLYAALGAVEIGSRIRIINVPAAAAPLGTLDLFVEGWTETPTPTTYRVVFDTSPVVAERIKLSDATYGRLGCDGQTLNTALTNSATTVIIDTAAGKPTFTTTGGQYPSKIKVGEEVITLTAAPGGATSPQTFTGCLRGQQGTFPAAQAAGSVVTLWPRTGLAL